MGRAGPPNWSRPTACWKRHRSARTGPTRSLRTRPAFWPSLSAAAMIAPPGPNELADRLHAAWLGRCADCNLGKPVEGFGWNRARLRRYLEQALTRSPTTCRCWTQCLRA